jgi:hypothetical protein
LYFYNLELITLATEFGHLKKIKYLDLNGNNFSSKEKQKIIKMFEGTGSKIEWKKCCYWADTRRIRQKIRFQE